MCPSSKQPVLLCVVDAAIDRLLLLQLTVFFTLKSLEEGSHAVLVQKKKKSTLLELLPAANAARSSRDYVMNDVCFSRL